MDTPAGGVQNAWGFDSLFGVPGLAAGRYEGEVRFARAAGAGPLTVEPFAARWVR